MELYNKLCDMFIRPPRADYSIQHLGPHVFSMGGDRLVYRQDLEIKNHRGLTLQCSHFQRILGQKTASATPPPATTTAESAQSPPLIEQLYTTDITAPCVIYLHGNGGCRLDGIDEVKLVLSYNLSFFCFDFSGSGMSEGQYISLGCHEKDDVAAVIEYLHSIGVREFGLWGRSMGAATALMFTAEYFGPEVYSDPHTSAAASSAPATSSSKPPHFNPLFVGKDLRLRFLICDSPFESIHKLMHELAGSIMPRVPRALLSGVLLPIGTRMLRKSLHKRADFDLKKVDPMAIVGRCLPPVMFIHATMDRLIASHHSKNLCDKYGGPDKTVLEVLGDHNSLRPASCFDAVSTFIARCMGLLPTNQPHFGDSANFPATVAGRTEVTKSGKYYLCRRMPLFTNVETLSVLDSLVVVCIGDYGIRLVEPFTERVFEEHPFGALRNFCLHDELTVLLLVHVPVSMATMHSHSAAAENGAASGDPLTRTLGGEEQHEWIGLHSVEAPAIIKSIEEHVHTMLSSKIANIDPVELQANIAMVIERLLEERCLRRHQPVDANEIADTVVSALVDILPTLAGDGAAQVENRRLLKERIVESIYERAKHPPFEGKVVWQFGPTSGESQQAEPATTAVDHGNEQDSKGKARKKKPHK